MIYIPKHELVYQFANPSTKAVYKFLLGRNAKFFGLQLIYQKAGLIQYVQNLMLQTDSIISLEEAAHNAVPCLAKSLATVTQQKESKS